MQSQHARKVKHPFR